MGFASFAAALSNDVLSKAVLLLSDFSPLFGVLLGIAALSLLVGILGRFLPR